MKKLYACAVFSIPFVLFAQTPAQFDENAKIAAKQGAYLMAREVDKQPGDFVRLKSVPHDFSWDVKKTDSLLVPVKAVVSFTMTTSRSELQKSLAEAEQQDRWKSTDYKKIELTYVPTETGWTYLEGRSYLEILNRWFRVENEVCEQERLAICVVIDSFAVSK